MEAYSFFLYTICMNVDFDEALAFVKKYHDGQYRSNNFPVWHHLARVSKRLQFIIEYNKEGEDIEVKELVVAALGHDLLEDTKASHEEIKFIFGENGHRFIDGMTNTWGDNDVGPYVEKIAQSSEEVRLIKLSDLFDNITNTTYNLSVLGKDWANSYLLPIITPMKEVVEKTTFKKYEKTGEDFKFMVDTAFRVLKDELGRM